MGDVVKSRPSGIGIQGKVTKIIEIGKKWNSNTLLAYSYMRDDFSGGPLT